MSPATHFDHVAQLADLQGGLPAMEEQVVSTFSASLRRILIADDDPTTLRALSVHLDRWGYQAVPAKNGAEALAVLQGDDPPRLAVLDWNMPGIDGLEVCRRAREAQPLEPPYLILLTGRGRHEDLIAGLEGGADEYLPKPVDPEELLARLHAAWRIVDLQADLSQRVRTLEALPPHVEIVAEGQAVLRQTLRLCVTTFEETLSFPGLPRHLRIALRTCRELCLGSLGEGTEQDD